MSVTDNCQNNDSVTLRNTGGHWGTEVQDCVSGYQGTNRLYSAIVGDTLYTVRLKGGGASSTTAWVIGETCQGDEIDTYGCCTWDCNRWLRLLPGYNVAYPSPGCIRTSGKHDGSGPYYCLQEVPWPRVYDPNYDMWRQTGIGTSRMTRQKWTCN